MIDRLGAHLMPRFPRAGLVVRSFASRYVGERELAILPQLVDPKRLSIDVGANWGVYSARLAKLSKGVVAFEPNPAIAGMLAQALPSVRVIACALGSEEGAATLRIPVMSNGDGAAGHGSLLPIAGEIDAFGVAVRTLDSFGLTNVGFIKIDVEGFEVQVVLGAWETIQRERPTMLIEIPGAGERSEIFERLGRLGYEALFYHDGRLRSVADWAPELAGEKPYVNFVFRLG